MIQLQQLQTYHGPNPFSSEPIVVVAMQLTPEAEARVDAQAAAMARAFATWWSLPSRLPEEDGAVYVARVLADWALAALNEVRGYLHAAGARREQNRVLIWLGHHDVATSVQALVLAARFFAAGTLADAGETDRDKVMSAFWRRCRASHPDYQAKVLMEAARACDVPYLPFIAPMRLWQFGWGCRSLTFFESRSEEDSHSGMKVVQDKAASKLYFEMMGAPVAKHSIVSQEDELGRAAAHVGWPCVLKPLGMSQAKGVTINIRDSAELRRAFVGARKLTQSPLMVESHVDGDVHRLLVIRGRFYAATRREPAAVVGDGVSTVIALVERFNHGRIANATPGSYLGPVPVDGELDLAIAKQGCDRQTVLEEGRRLRLREIPLQGTGASNTDVSHLAHPDIKIMAEMLARSLGVQIAGFDYLTPDISRSYREVGAFLEINGTPSLRGHLVDDQDVRGVGAAILGSHPARIPVVLVVAPAAEVANYSGESLNRVGLGWRCGEAVGLGSTRLNLDGGHLVSATRALLMNRCVDAVLLVCDPRELMTVGMPVDRVDHCFIAAGVLPPIWGEVLRRQSGGIAPLPPAEAFAGTLDALLASPY